MSTEIYTVGGSNACLLIFRYTVADDDMLLCKNEMSYCPYLALPPIFDIRWWKSSPRPRISWEVKTSYLPDLLRRFLFFLNIFSRERVEPRMIYRPYCLANESCVT